MNPTDRERIFCENVKILREQHHLSKREMARRMGIGLTTLNELEAGRLPRRLKAGAFLRLMDLSGLTGEELLSPILK